MKERLGNFRIRSCTEEDKKLLNDPEFIEKNKERALGLHVSLYFFQCFFTDIPLFCQKASLVPNKHGRRFHFGTGQCFANAFHLILNHSRKARF